MVLGGILLVVIGFLVWLGGNEVTHRLASIHTEAREEVSGGMRMSIDRDCLRMLFKRPILGWGLGTFPTVYPAVPQLLYHVLRQPGAQRLSATAGRNRPCRISDRRLVSRAGLPPSRVQTEELD